MFGRLYNALAILAIAHLLALGGAAGMLYSQGRLTSDAIDQITKILRGDAQLATSQPADAHAADPHAAPDAAHAAGADGHGDGHAPDHGPASVAEMEHAQRNGQLRVAVMERAQQDLKSQQELVRQLLGDLLQRSEAFDASIAAWERRKQMQLDEVQDDGFRKLVDYVGKLPAKQAKDYLIRKYKESPPDAVRLLNALRTSTGKAILELMKSPDESTIMFELLEQLAEQDLDRIAPQAGTSAANASP